jgi:hypothetical protein
MMRGMITEHNFAEAERCFPGIVHYYRELKVKPETFLELLWGFVNRSCERSESVQVAPCPAIPFGIR